MNFKIPEKYYNYFFITGILLALLPFFLIARYNHPAGYDDYNNALTVLAKGASDSFIYIYEGWSGRYTQIFLLSYFSPMLFESWLTGTKFFPIITFLLFILSASYLLKALHKPAGWKLPILLAMVFLVLYLFAIDTVSEIFYWFTGAAAYSYGIIFFMVFIGSLLNYFSAVTLFQKSLYLVLSAVFLGGSIGTNESGLMAILFVLTLIVIGAFWQHSRFRFFLLGILAFALVCALFSVKAPGNAARAALVHGTTEIYTISKIIKPLIHSLVYSCLKYFSWANNLALMLATLLFIPFGKEIVARNPWFSKIKKINPFIFVVLTILFIAVQAFPPYFGTTDVDPRVWSFIYFFFLFGWFFTALAFINYYGHFFPNFDLRLLSPLKVGMILLLFLSGSGNVSKAGFDLVARAPAYNQTMLARYELAKHSQGMSLTVPPSAERVYQVPTTIFASDITTDSADYRNTSFSQYFGIKSIKLTNEPLR
jgi:hypothetical protein